ncbi:MAG: PQQ-binding-like beta-propeller repeat protein [Gammaproteobacteria bacterium]
MTYEVMLMKGPRSSCLIRTLMDIRSLFVALAVLLLAACGGGSSSSNNNNTGVTMSVSPQNISVSASTTQPAPTGSFQVNFTGLTQGQTAYSLVTYTTQGISTVLNPGGALPATITIEFNSPATMGVGTYNDAVRVEGCIDQACTQEVGNSPLTVQVKYTVTQGPPPALNSVSPTSVTAGGPPFILTALGANFTSESVVRWNGADQTTTYVSSTELTAQIPASDINTTGAASVVVYDYTSPTGTTSAQIVTIAPASIDAVSYQLNPAHTGAVNFASVSFPSNSTWSVDVGGTPSYALITDGKVIVVVDLSGDATEILAMDQSTGNIVWGPIMTTGTIDASYDNGRVFVLNSVIGSPATLEAYDVNTGALDWSKVLTGQDDFEGAPTAADGVVYAYGAGFRGAFQYQSSSQHTHKGVIF